MKESTAKWFKRISHISLFVISDLLTIALFIQFSDELIYQVLWGVLANALEFLKIYLFLQVKAHFKEKGFNSKVLAIGTFMIYFGLAFVSATASINFTLLSIEDQSFSSSQANSSIDLYASDLEEIGDDLERVNSQLASQTKRYNETDELYITVRERMSEAIDKLEEKKDSLIEERASLTEKKKEASKDKETVSIDSFSLMGEKIGLDGKQVMLYLMTLLVFLLEISLAITSGSIKTAVKVNESRSKLNKYIVSLMKVNGIRLNSDKKIAEDTGLSLHDCKRFKSMLLGMTYDGVPLITTGKGGSKANYSQKQILQIVNARLKLGM